MTTERIPSRAVDPFNRSAASSARGSARSALSVALAQSPRMSRQRQVLQANFGTAAPEQVTRRQAPAIDTGVAQRMVVAAAPVATIDRIIAADLAFQHERAGGEALSLESVGQDTPGTHSISSSEWIVVCGHGDTSAIDGVKPEQMSNCLKRVANHANAGGVYLSACNSATLEKGGSSYLKRFHKAFTDGSQAPGPQVVGATGYKINDFDEVSGEQQVAVPVARGIKAGELQAKNWSASGMSGMINDPLGASSLDEVLKQGRALLSQTQFREFFRGFVGDLKQAKLLEPDQLRDQKGRSIDLR